VRAYGRRHRLTFGTNHDGWNEDRVRVELDEILRQIERGTCEPPSRKPDPTVMVEDDQTLHVTASAGGAGARPSWPRRPGSTIGGG
jgi:hypothetical protein